MDATPNGMFERRHLNSNIAIAHDSNRLCVQALLLAPNMLKPRKSGRQQGGYPPGPDLGWQRLIRLV